MQAANYNAARTGLQKKFGSTDQAIMSRAQSGIDSSIEVSYKEGDAKTWVHDLLTGAGSSQGHLLHSAEGNPKVGVIRQSTVPNGLHNELKVEYLNEQAIKNDRHHAGFDDIGYVEQNRKSINYVEVPKGGTFYDAMEAAYRIKNKKTGTTDKLSATDQQQISTGVNKFTKLNPSRNKSFINEDGNKQSYFHVNAGEQFKLTDLFKLF